MKCCSWANRRKEETINMSWPEPEPPNETSTKLHWWNHFKHYKMHRMWMWGISTSESVCTHWQTPDDTAGLNRPLGILIKEDITSANICVLNSAQCHSNIPSYQIKMIYEFTYSLIEHVNSHFWHTNTPKTTSNAGKNKTHYPFL